MHQDSDGAPVIQALDRLLGLRRAALAAGPLPLNDADIVVLGHFCQIFGGLRCDDPELAAALATLPGLDQTGNWDAARSGALPLVAPAARPGLLAAAGPLLLIYWTGDAIPAGALAAAGDVVVRPLANLAMGLWRCRLMLLYQPQAADHAAMALDSLAFLFNDRSLDPLMLADRLHQSRAIRFEEELAALRRVAAEQQQALAYYRDLALGADRRGR